MSIENLNLVTHASAAVLPMLTRTGSIPRVVGVAVSLIPPILLASPPLAHLILTAVSWISHRQYSNNAASQFIAKFAWRLPECLTSGYALSQSDVPKILGLGKETYLLAEAGVLAAGAIGSFRSLEIGITGRDRTLDIPYTSPAQRAALSVIGTLGLAQVVDAIKNIAIGLFAVQSLDPEEQYFIFKHHSLETLGGPEKGCRAVIIDGDPSEWGNREGGHSWPLAEELYRNCLVRTYRVDPNSTVPECDVAEKGKKALGGPLNILALLGHADEKLIVLNQRTYFTGSSNQTTCLKDHLQPDAQMILAGCNTATGTNPLAEKVSRHLNDIEVVGFSAYFHLDLSTISWDGKKVRLWSYFPIDNQGNWIFPWSNTARTFKSSPSDEQL
jgi:hypothetical protein